MPRRGAGVVFEFSSQGVSIPCFGLCVWTHTEGVCSLFVHLHLNREWNPCPCRSSRYLGASFPFSHPPPLTRSPSPARAGEAEMAGYSLPPLLQGSGQPLPITLRLSACVLGRFSHTTCCPISFVLRTCFLDRSASGGGGTRKDCRTRISSFSSPFCMKTRPQLNHGHTFAKIFHRGGDLCA